MSGVPWNLVGNIYFFLALGKEAEDFKGFMVEGGIDRDPIQGWMRSIESPNKKLQIN